MSAVGVANQALLVDESGPFAGVVYDGSVYQTDLEFSKDDSQVCDNMHYDYHTPSKRMFSGVYWNQRVSTSVHVSSVCVQNTSFCQSAGGGIKLQLVTALVNIIIVVIIMAIYETLEILYLNGFMG